jgi:hypothetical protein
MEAMSAARSLVSIEPSPAAACIAPLWGKAKYPFQAGKVKVVAFWQIMVLANNGRV